MLMNNMELPEKYYKNTRREMLSFIPGGSKRILDVGCAEGIFGATLKAERGAVVWGIELNAYVAAVAATKLDKVIVGSIEEIDEDLPDAFFDCIVFNDVLEHLSNPWAALMKMTSKIIPGGCVVASIPNIRYFRVLDDLLFRKKFTYKSEGVLDVTHLRFFTDQTIIEMFAACGLTLELIEGLKWEALPLKYSIINRITLRWFEDIRYKQFVCVARK
jgi:2-polyprenyl-3-methyl-5-hydroxy-6-metoxy-1,4-benzoquinol methylase